MIEILPSYNTRSTIRHIMATKAQNHVTSGSEAELRERKSSGSTPFPETPGPAAGGAVNMGAVAIAVIVGACAAVAALIAGNSFLMALAIYSGCGVLGAGVLVAIYMIGDAARSRKDPQMLRSDMAV